MTFNEIHKTCRKLAEKKRVRERDGEEETEGGTGEGETEKKKKGSTTRHQADSEQA